MLLVNRSRLYYKTKPVDKFEHELTMKIYNYWEEHNNKCSRVIMHDLYEYDGIKISRNKIRRRMQDLGIKGILPKRNLSKIGHLQYKHPYLLSGMNIYGANQVWANDITYVKLTTGTMYIICLIDVYSRYIVSYIITNILDSIGCIECLTNALKYNKPIILNSDQGAQFTSHSWINCLRQNKILISMDSKGRYADNIYIERFWLTLKYECIFMLGIENAQELHQQVKAYIKYYNTRRLHSALGYKTPESIYFTDGGTNNECELFCNWPADDDRVKKSRKTVKPNIVKPLATKKKY